MSINGAEHPDDRIAMLEAQLQGAIMMVGCLVRRAGGKVTITPAEMLEIYAYTLIRDDHPEDAFITLYTQLTPKEDDDGSEDDGTDRD